MLSRAAGQYNCYIHQSCTLRRRRSRRRPPRPLIRKYHKRIYGCYCLAWYRDDRLGSWFWYRVVADSWHSIWSGNDDMQIGMWTSPGTHSIWLRSFMRKIQSKTKAYGFCRKDTIYDWKGPDGLQSERIRTQRDGQWEFQVSSEDTFRYMGIEASR
jgi:hypothetical protein